MAFKRSSPLPGFGLTFGYTVTYLALLVLIPMGALSLRVATHMTWAEFWKLATADIAVATYRLTFGASLAAALLNAVFGTLLAWVLARYEFTGRRLLDALVDFPFALPTAVAGLTLADLFSGNGWLGRFLMPLGIKVAYTWLGIVVALTFVGLPFVVRTLQPVLENLDRETEEAAATLGAGRLRTFFSVIVPTLTPALLTGFALSRAALPLTTVKQPSEREMPDILVAMRASCSRCGAMVASRCCSALLFRRENARARLIAVIRRSASSPNRFAN